CTTPLPSANLDRMYLETENALTFGCQPDYNAYTMQTNLRPNTSDETLRSAGGHIHIGYKDAPEYDPEYYIPDEERANIVRALDLFIGVPSILLEPDNKRKELYGKAGAFRPKPYGLEYRTISNYYMEDKKLIEWVYNQ